MNNFQTHTDALTTVQLASRIHRMRRRKHRLPLSADKSLGPNNATGSATISLYTIIQVFSMSCSNDLNSNLLQKKIKKNRKFIWFI